MSKLSFALVGCGRIGNRHLEHIVQVGTLAAVCDTDSGRLKSAMDRFQVPGFDSIEKMLSAGLNFQIVSVCTPNGFHAEHAIRSLKAGYHVLCEKPMAISVDDCGEMIKTAESANKRLFVIKQNRFNPPVAAVKKLINEGGLGKIFSVQLSCFWNRNENYYRDSWKGTLKLDGGTLFTQFSHFVDLLYWMFGDVREVFAITRNYAHQGIMEFEDTGVVALEFTKGMIGTIHYTVNSYGKNMEGSLTIFGEKGTIKIGGQYLNELEYQHLAGSKIEGLPEGNRPNDYGEYQGSMSNHDKVYQNVVDVLSKGSAISTNAFEGLKTVEIIDKIYRAAKKNSQ